MGKVIPFRRGDDPLWLNYCAAIRIGEPRLIEDAWFRWLESFVTDPKERAALPLPWILRAERGA